MTNLYIHSLDWIKKENRITDIENVYKEFYKNEKVTYTLPKGDLPEWVDWVYPPRFGENHTFGKSYVSVIDNGSVWMCDKGEGMVYALTPDNKCIYDMVFHLYWRYFEKAAAKQIPHTASNHGRLGVLAWAGHTNYWHWLHDTLGRFHLLELSGYKIDKYVLPPMTKPFQWQTVQLLGIPRDKIIEFTPGERLQAEKLILPSVPFNIGTCVKWTIEFIREKFLTSQSKKNSSNVERIYISREDAAWRKVANENKLLKLLDKKGFKKVTLGSLTVQEQIDLFSSAKVIISPNGAGLANLMFCRPKTKILQLFTATSDEFVKIGQYLDLDYHLLKCRIANPGAKGHEVIKNLVVDVRKVAVILEEEGIT
ncbi:glycosyltransferase 61 family protein [Virgibacillus kimchii]